MKKIILLIAMLIGSLNTSIATFGDVLYIKYIYTPILSSSQDDADMIGILHKGYVVLDQGESNDFIKVKLIDGKTGYILKSNLGDNESSNIKINGGMGAVTNNSFLLKRAGLNSPKTGLLSEGTLFKVLHTNYINDNYIKIRILNGKNSGKEGFIHKQNTEIKTNYKLENDIVTFIEKNQKNNLVSNTSKVNTSFNKEDDEISNGLSSAKEKLTGPKEQDYSEENYLDENITPSINNVNSNNDTSNFLDQLNNTLNNDNIKESELDKVSDNSINDLLGGISNTLLNDENNINNTTKSTTPSTTSTTSTVSKTGSNNDMGDFLSGLSGLLGE